MWLFIVLEPLKLVLGLPGGSDGKESASNAGDQVQSLGEEDPLEKDMATHSSILAWRTPWTGACQAPLSMHISRQEY